MAWHWLLYLLICTIAVVASLFIISPKYLKNRNLAIPFLVVMYVTYVARPFLSFTFGYGMSAMDAYLPGLSDEINRSLKDITISIVLAFIFFAAGYRLINRPELMYKNIKKFSNLYASKYFLRFSILLILFGYLGFLISRRGFLSSGSDVEFIRYTGGVIYGNTTGYFEFANYFVVTGALLFFATTRKIIPTILFVAPWVLNQLFVGWSRYMVINLTFGFAVIELLRSEINIRKTDLKKILVFGLAALALFTFISMRGDRFFLQNRRSPIEGLKKSLSMPIDQLLGDFAGFEGSWFVLQEINSVEPKYGAGVFYQFIVLPIPRLLWPEKPLKAEFSWGSIFNIDELSNSRWRGSLQNPYDYIWHNTAVKGSIGYAIEEWGWLGVPLNFLLLGLFFAWFEKKFITSNISPAWLVSYSVTYVFACLQGRNDVFGFSIIYIFIFYIPYVLIQIITNRYCRTTQVKLERSRFNQVAYPLRR